MTNASKAVLSAVTAATPLFCASCVSTPSPYASKIIEADEKGVAQCTFLGLVSGSSSLSATAQARGRQNAKTAALEDAAHKGATHIVWTDVHSTFNNGASAQGRAYRCP